MNSERKNLGGNYCSSAALLQAAGLRPTQQRLALAGWLFDGCDKHVTAEQVRAAALKMHARVSLATIYNTLKNFTDAGLLRQIAFEGGHIYFDTNTENYHHVFDEDSRLLSDIPASAVRIVFLPKMLAKKFLSRVDVLIRIRAAK